MTALLETQDLSKTFTLHGRGGLQLPVFAGINLSVRAGECLALTGHSGSGKSSLVALPVRQLRGHGRRGAHTPRR
jgi:alpha-D-ribose 1-methylphosphonate 5-triphosphate synthase subunit PhnL